MLVKVQTEPERPAVHILLHLLYYTRMCVLTARNTDSLTDTSTRTIITMPQEIKSFFSENVTCPPPMPPTLHGVATDPPRPLKPLSWALCAVEAPCSMTSTLFTNCFLLQCQSFIFSKASLVLHW